MKKILLATLMGLVLVFSGFFLLYESFVTGKAWLLIPTCILIIVGFYSLFRTGKSDDTIVTKTKNSPIPNNKNPEDRIKKNNELLNEWKKTTEQRDRLRILELAGEKKDN